ncbi:methyltransferase [Mucilaginibacter sp. BJC16-A38]|uniref:tRNA1(Val) (adenine(37)-N6)-methyltransferase n=1 Tax=Mucilaginibacter phenanthrenivorans TaxID=1234842 RepID=UPI0021578071|nr:methyltransferase [Mucilaginibacter phenanthrenivorans]MCR8557181.1 methyltransferase [Mucilaginibacter phenanthrenivorans]
MKINTDGVLLGAMASNNQAEKILDIGTGTGVIALMLAQRFIDAQIDAVEIDTSAAKTAGGNFKNSAFNDRLNIFPESVETFFNEHPGNKYDLIISNPPFYINSLESPKEKKTLAKHTDADFFGELIKGIAQHLSPKGLCWLILPVQTAELIKELATESGLYQHKIITVRSFEYSEPHREIVCFGFNDVLIETANFTIYEAIGVYSTQYKALLQPFFLNF